MCQFAGLDLAERPVDEEVGLPDLDDSTDPVARQLALAGQSADHLWYHPESGHRIADPALDRCYQLVYRQVFRGA